MKRAFTLIELLVVVTIIVILLAVLTPAVQKAIEAAEKAVCLAHMHSIGQGCQIYAAENKRVLPPSEFANPGGGANLRAWSYDLRATQDGNVFDNVVGDPMGLGYLPAAGLLPTTQLGKVMHCPSFDNTGGSGAMSDVVISNAIPSLSSVGATWWADEVYPKSGPTGYRVIAGYHYRGASYFWGSGVMKSQKVGSQDVLAVDPFDSRFSGNLNAGGGFGHAEGYNRVFADGHGGWLPDPKRILETEHQVRVGAFDGRNGNTGYGNEHKDEIAWRALAKSEGMSTQ